MNKRIRELAVKAGAGPKGQPVVIAMMDIEKFEKLIRADEREICEKICARIHWDFRKTGEDKKAYGVLSCLAEIRDRGQK